MSNTEKFVRDDGTVNLVNIPMLKECCKELETSFYKAVGSGSYDLPKVVKLCDCHMKISEAIVILERFQNMLLHYAQQQQLIRKAEEETKRVTEPHIRRVEDDGIPDKL